MIKFIRRICRINTLLKEMELLTAKVENLPTFTEDIMAQRLGDFEKKVQAISFAYTASVDDAKSEYLKLYVKSRLDCMQSQLEKLEKGK
jgi:hypothetical protein